MSQVKTIHLNGIRNSRSRNTKADTPTRSSVSTDRLSERLPPRQTPGRHWTEFISFHRLVNVSSKEMTGRSTVIQVEFESGWVRRLRNIEYNRWQLSRFASQALTPISNSGFAEIENVIAVVNVSQFVCVFFSRSDYELAFQGLRNNKNRSTRNDAEDERHTHTRNELRFTNSDYFYNNSGAIYTFVTMTPWAMGRNWVWNELHNSSARDMRRLLIANAGHNFIEFQLGIVWIVLFASRESYEIWLVTMTATRTDS